MQPDIVCPEDYGVPATAECSELPEIIGVRHHSPACAHLVRERILQLKPRYVLIEGPMDFNSRLHELFLAHQLPLAIYSYGMASTKGQGSRRGSWSPFAEHSPEWQALLAGRAVNAELRFIDLPAWHPACAGMINRYADLADVQQQRQATALDLALGQCLGIEGPDALWDSLFEVPGSTGELSRQLRYYFEQLRADCAGSVENQARESMMASWISWAMQRREGSVLVVCGGYHAPALQQLWRQMSQSKVPEPVLPPLASCFADGSTQAEYITGSYLVPYSYKRLDAFTGYASGMPSPAFQQWVWEHGMAQAGTLLLQKVFARLRQRGVPASTADMAAVYARGQALARLRGHGVPLRCDWLDAMVGTLVKDALSVQVPWSYRGTLRSGTDPVLVEILSVLSGERQGALDPQTPAPPLLHAVGLLLDSLQLTAQCELTLQLSEQEDLRRSRVLHQLRMLDIPGFRLLGGKRPPCSVQLEEVWHLSTPLEQTPALIEAACYGATLAEAAGGKMEERFITACAASHAVSLLVDLLNDALLADVSNFNQQIIDALDRAIQQESRFTELGQAIGILHQIYRYGDGSSLYGALILQVLLQQLFDRALWLCEAPGSVPASESLSHITAFSALKALLRDLLSMSPEQKSSWFPAIEIERAFAVFRRKSVAENADPLSRGAAMGLVMSLCRDPLPLSPLDLLSRIPVARIGDGLSGLIALARHELTEEEAFVSGLDQLVQALDDGDFLAALPGMRAAFAWLPPRERGEFARRILRLHDKDHFACSVLTGGITAASPEHIAGLQYLETQAMAKLALWGVT